MGAQGSWSLGKIWLQQVHTQLRKTRGTPARCLQGLSLQRHMCGGLNPLSEVVGSPGLLHPPCWSCTRRGELSIPPWGYPRTAPIAARITQRLASSAPNRSQAWKTTQLKQHVSPLRDSVAKAAGLQQSLSADPVHPSCLSGLSLHSSTCAFHRYLKIEIITTSSLFPAWLEK